VTQLEGDTVPQANDPSRVVALCRHWHAHGVGTWPDSFKDQRDRSYYRHALEVVGALTCGGEATPRLEEMGAIDAVAGQTAFRQGLRASLVFSRWLEWAGAGDLSDLDPDTAVNFLEAETKLASTTATRRASTLRRWLDWCTEPLPSGLGHALKLALDPVDLRSRSAHKFGDAKAILARQLGLSARDLAIKTITDRNNYGNRISEATRVAPAALILVAADVVDRDALARDYGSRALTRPPTLVVEREQEGWRCLEVVCGDERLFDPFPADIERRLLEHTATTDDAPAEDVEEAIELLVALEDQPISVIDSIAGELPPRLRALCHQKQVSSGKQAHNLVAEALGQRPPLLLVVAPRDLEDAIERAVAQAARADDGDARVLFALHDGHRFSVVESQHTRPALAPPPIPSRAAVAGASVATRLGSLQWEGASYLAWNERLLDYVFAADEKSDPVTRIAANPEELRRAVGDVDADPDAVAARLREVFRREVPDGRSLDRQLGMGASVPLDEIPHFFGLLWMTCLICWGYPRQNDGSFDTRLREILGRRTNYQHLDDAWKALAEWLRHAAGYRPLELPEPDGFRSLIGRSYFLAFPHGRDRLRLSEVLAEAGLSGRHLPVPSALQALVDNRRQFSSDFQHDLEEFRKSWAAGEDPAKSAFWRAVQQEAISPSHDAEKSKPRATLFAREEDELLQPLLAWPNNVAPPRGLEAQADEDLEDLEADLLLDVDGDAAGIAAKQLASPMLLDAATRAAIQQGVLLFVEVDDWEYRLLDGDVSEATGALVREDRLGAFIEAFGGRVDHAGHPAWRAVLGPQVVARLAPPPGLEEVDQLCVSSAQPRPRFTGGIRTPGGHLWSSSHPPAVRAVGATHVEAEFCGASAPCEPSGDGIWRLPERLIDEAQCPADLVVGARWEVDGPGGTTLTRHGVATTRLWRQVVGWQYKPPPGSHDTHYWLEGVIPPMASVTGGSPVDLGLTTRDPAEAADLLEFDSSARFLGPGCGELSASRDDPSFDWMAIGGLNNPDWVIFVGDPDFPTPHDDGYSNNKGDLRHWRRSFKSMERARVRTMEGYEPLETHPEVAAEFRSRAASIKRGHTPKIRREVKEDPRLKTRSDLQHQSGQAREPSSKLWEAIAVVAAISQRRRGLSGKEFQQVILDLTTSDDFLLANEVRRAWAEMGAIDVLRRQDRGNLVIVARRPRFLMVRDGPRILGLLQGLVPKVLDAQLGALAKDAGLEHDHRPRVAPAWTPPLPLVWVDSPAVLRTLSQRLDLPDPMWMSWPQEGTPGNLDATKAVPLHGDAPPEYQTEATWAWSTGRFSRGGIDVGEEIEVTRRRHPLRPAVYVVSKAARPMGWSLSRNWALLEASRHRAEAPFAVQGGTLVSTGASPVHLPLPIARMCAILGDSCPGPVAARPSRIEYHYPLGPAVWASLDPLLPKHWTSTESE